MDEPDHEKLRQELESAASKARNGTGARRSVSGRTALIGFLAAVPVATAALIAVSASADDSRPVPAEQTGIAPGVAPQTPSRTSTGTRPPTTPTGPDLPPHPEPPPDEDQPVAHTVRPGETLAEIALHYRVPLEQIVEQNAIADPDRIQTGHSLAIHPAPPGQILIETGGTLSGYAERHETTVAHLLALNPQITDPDRLVAGGRLRVR
jgi:LysM repeat protein